MSPVGTCMVLQEIRSDWVLGGVVDLVDAFTAAGCLHRSLPPVAGAIDATDAADSGDDMSLHGWSVANLKSKNSAMSSQVLPQREP